MRGASILIEWSCRRLTTRVQTLAQWPWPKRRSSIRCAIPCSARYTFIVSLVQVATLLSDAKLVERVLHLSLRSRLCTAPC